MQIDPQQLVDRIMELDEHRRRLYESLDKITLVVTTGALVLSITVLDKIGFPYSRATLSLLFLSWSFLLAGLLANLLSFWFSIADAGKKQRYLDGGIEDPSTLQIKEVQIGNHRCSKIVQPEAFRKVTDLCNVFSTIGLFIGIGLLALYVAFVQCKKFETLSSAPMTTSVKMSPANSMQVTPNGTPDG